MCGRNYLNIYLWPLLPLTLLRHCPNVHGKNAQILDNFVTCHVPEVLS